MPQRVPLAWRNVVHERGRAMVGIAGVGFAIMLMFLQLGFFGSVILGATLNFDDLDYDVVILSRDYSFVHSPREFPRQRLLQAVAHPDVASGAPFYIGMATWRNTDTGVKNSVMLYGFDPSRPVFRTESINRHLSELRRSDRVLVDSQTRPKYGPRTAGDAVEVAGRKVTVIDQYRLGTAFVELGMMVVSDLNFVRLQRGRTLDDVGLGLLKLKPGAPPEEVARQLQAQLPDDVKVWTRVTFRNHEVRHWLVSTSTGFIFGSGVLVAVLVGAVILYQTVSTQIISKLNEYATLKAIGYQPRQILRIVLEQACTIAVLGFIPGLLAAFGLYAAVEKAVYLPMEMTSLRVATVLALVIGMAVAAGMLAYRKVHAADPADLF